ncbi:hypothetical protein M8J75_007733 [Diaphorina citri]|nr:hypothetical protein M8J75_007733 [Diaphorina citri]
MQSAKQKYQCPLPLLIPGLQPCRTNSSLPPVHPVTSATRSYAMVTEQDIAEEYGSALSDLTFNSKPLINMLTMLADEYQNHASIIVTILERHLVKVRAEVKLPVLYLIDSIVKNLGVRYTQLFKKNIASLFCGVFEKVDEKVRANMFKLRTTWDGVFPEECLNQLDIGVNQIDRAWPIKSAMAMAAVGAPAVTLSSSAIEASKETLLKKQKELLELQKKRLELELLQTKAKLEEQERQKEKLQIQQDVKTLLPQLKEDVAKLLSAPNPNLEKAKEFKSKLEQINAIVAAQHSMNDSEVVPVSPDASVTKTSSRTSVASSKVKQSRSSSSSGGGVPVPQNAVKPTTSAAPFVNPFIKHSTHPASSLPSEVIPSVPQRVSINPVSSDLVTAVAVRRTAAGNHPPAVRDPRLRRSENTSAPPPPVTPVATTFTVTISDPISDKKKIERRERKSSHNSNETPSNEDLFGNGDSYRKKEKSKSSSSSRSSSSSKDRRDDKSESGKKSSKSESSSEKRQKDRESETTSSPGKHQSNKKTSNEKSSTKSKSDDVRPSKSSESVPVASSVVDKARKEKSEKPPLLKPHQLPPIPKLKKKTSETKSETDSQVKSSSKTKESAEEKSSSESKKSNTSKPYKSMELSTLEETIRLKKQQIEDELRANAKNLQELVEKNKKEKIVINNSAKEDDLKDKSLDSSVEDIANVDDIIRMKKPEVAPSKYNMDVDYNETDIDDIIRMRKQEKKTKDDHVMNNAKPDSRMEVDEHTTQEDSATGKIQINVEPVKDAPTSVIVKARTDENEHPNKGNEKKMENPVTEEKKTSPPRPRLFIKNIALLTKPQTPPSQDLEEISEDELVSEESQQSRKLPIPISSLLDDDTDEDAGEIDTDHDADLSPGAGKFKELKASSLKRLRQFVRSRDQLTPSPPPPPTSKEMTARSTGESSQQNDLVQLHKGDVDLRPLLMPNSTEEPPTKKPKPEGTVDIFGFGMQDVDLRNPRPTGPRLPSPPPPPIISKEDAANAPGSPTQQTSAGGKAEKRKIRVKPYAQLEKKYDISPDDGSKNYDTDMRHLATPTAPTTPSRNVKAIVKQAEIDLKNGSISFADYSNILRRLSSLHSEPSTPKVSESEQPPSLPVTDHISPPPLPPIGLLDDDPVLDDSESSPPNTLPSSLPVSLPSSQSIQPTMPMPMLAQPGMMPHPMLPQMPPMLPFQGPMVRPNASPFPGMPTPALPPGPSMPIMPGMPAMTTPSLPFIPRPPANFTSYGRLAPADPDILASIMRDPMKAINIDNIPRPIRFYGHTGIVFLSWDDPREIGFMKGVRKITIDGTETVLCQLNAPYKEFMIDGAKHRIRLGNPTRELYIDDDYYECCFGGPPLRVDIGGKSHLVQLEGPPPTVTIDTKKRTDLCAGRVDLYIDDKIHVPMFLDCKPHKVDVNGFPYILRFVEALRILVINGSPFKINFGGTPVTIALHDKNHSFAFSPLPPGVRQGYVTIAHMDGGRLPSPPPQKRPPPRNRGVISAPPALEEDNSQDSGVVGLGKSDEGIPFLNSSEINVTDLFAKLTTKYSLHLDWHFRINRRERDLGRSVQSRKFYFSAREWCAYYEIEDDENKGQSWFEMQELSGTDGQLDRDNSSPGREVASCTAELNEVEPRCGVCRDRFEQFYNEEKEEWQLRRAVRVDGVAYHPMCYQDHLASLEAKQKEGSPPREDTLTEEEGPVPEDAEEFTRQIPVGIYTIADDNEEEDKETSVQVIEQYPTDAAQLKTEAESDLSDVSNVKTELGDNAAPPLLQAEDLPLLGDGVSVVKTERVEEAQEAMQVEEETRDELKELEEPSEPTSVDEEMKPIPEEPLDQVKSEEVEAPAADTETENEKPQDEEIKEPSEPLEDMESAKENAEEMDESSFELKESDTNEDVKDEKKSKPETGELLGDEISPRIIVMTTTDIDGNIQGKPTVPSSLPAPAKIKINITKTVLPGNIVKPIEPVLDEASSSPKQMETDVPQEDANATPLNQPKSVKPLIASKKMTHYPPLSKGKDLSALCSIM